MQSSANGPRWEASPLDSISDSDTDDKWWLSSIGTQPMTDTYACMYGEEGQMGTAGMSDLVAETRWSVGRGW